MASAAARMSHVASPTTPSSISSSTASQERGVLGRPERGVGPEGDAADLFVAHAGVIAHEDVLGPEVGRSAAGGDAENEQLALSLAEGGGEEDVPVEAEKGSGEAGMVGEGAESVA